MKKKLTYRDKLIELARIYGVREVQDYIRNKKNLTAGQLELILRKNKIIIPKDFNTNFFKENFTKPISKVSRHIDTLKEDSVKSANRFSRRVSYFKEDTFRSIFRFFLNRWRNLGSFGLGILNTLPKLGLAIYNFFGNIFVDIFNNIYNQKFNISKTSRLIPTFFAIVFISALIITGITLFDSYKSFNQIVKKDIQKENIKPKIKKDAKKPNLKEPKVKVKEKEQATKPKIKKEKKQTRVNEVILPDLNLKTETVLNLFKDVDYDLKSVRYNKTVKPIYFTQFPKDLDEIKNVQLKKETFIKIVLPLIVAENEKILNDRSNLLKIVSKKYTTDEEKQWLRQKLLEYKVKKGNINELKIRMDMIPVSIALAQAAKESGWGTSRFALEGNAIFGQWTWTGQGIEPLLKDKSKSHKILRFPILRASVKSYKNNLNTHKSYREFRNKRFELRKSNKSINGLELTKMLENYAETGSEYTKILSKIIIQNRLMDFEPVKLANSILKQELDL